MLVSDCLTNILRCGSYFSGRVLTALQLFNITSPNDFSYFKTPEYEGKITQNHKDIDQAIKCIK